MFPLRPLALVCFAAFLVTGNAFADDARKRASDLFTQGEARFKVGDYTGAAAAFEEANRLSPHPNILWNIARSFERGGESVRAANAYQSFLHATKEGAPDRAAAAQSLARLSKVLGRLELHPPDDALVAVDGALALGSLQFVSPGSHTVRMKIGGKDQSQTVRVEAGAMLSVSPLAVAAETPAEPTPAASPPVAADAAPHGSPGVSPAFFFVGTGLTLVATGFAVGFGIDTLNERDRFDGAPDRGTFDSGRDKQLRTNVTIGVAAGMAALTAITGLFLVDWRGKDRRAAQLRVGPGSVGVSGLF